jgi:hypothetical protein
MPAYGGNSARDASMLLRVLFQGVDPDQVREAVIDTIQRAMAKDPPPSLKDFNDVAPTLPQPPTVDITNVTMVPTDSTIANVAASGH